MILTILPGSVSLVTSSFFIVADVPASLWFYRYRGRFVIDKTGLSGKFDFHLEEEITAEFRQRFPELADVWGPSRAPPLPKALQQQLGLKLDSTKGLVEFLVVGHIERPSPNWRGGLWCLDTLKGEEA